MKLPNKWASELLSKDKNISKKAANHIINNSDLDAWKCLIDNSDFIFDYIKNKAGKMLTNEVNSDNITNLFAFLKIHSLDWDNHIAGIFAKYTNEEINTGFLEMLTNGTEHEKAYASKYFGIVKYEKAIDCLFKATFCDYQPLKTNSAFALGILHDKKSYEFYINKLKSDDDWEKIDAAQFLSSYNNKEALIDILRAMNTSGMAEYLAGEAALLDDIYKYFDDDNAEYKALSLECFDNILSGIAEIWALNVIVDFKVYESVNKLVDLAKSSDDSMFLSKYSQLLLKSISKIRMFVENEEYRFDTDNNVMSELNDIYNLLSVNDQEFWDFQEENFIDELHANCEKRKLSAISLIGELNIKSAFDDLYSIITNDLESDIIISETLQTIKSLDMLENIPDKDSIISRIKDDTLVAIVKNILMIAN